MRKIPVVLIGAAVAAAGVLALSPADAHHPELEATCLTGTETIRVIAWAWDAPTLDERVNDNIEITFDGTPVGVGGFNEANGYTFTLDFPAPATSGTHTIRATSLHPWGTDEDDPHPVGVGEFRETTIALPCVAVAPTTTSTTTTGAATTATTTTGAAVAPTTGPTTTETPAEVEGITVTRPDVAAPVAVAPRFAG